MIRQYGPNVSPFRYVQTPRGQMECGTIPVGTICKPVLYILGRCQGTMPTVIVEAWLPRDYPSWNPATRKMTTKRIRGGHLAQVRCLHSGRRFTLSDAWLRDAEIVG